jgi:hypothetical protein
MWSTTRSRSFLVHDMPKCLQCLGRRCSIPRLSMVTILTYMSILQYYKETGPAYLDPIHIYMGTTRPHMQYRYLIILSNYKSGCGEGLAYIRTDIGRQNHNYSKCFLTGRYRQVDSMRTCRYCCKAPSYLDHETARQLRSSTVVRQKQGQ